MAQYSLVWCDVPREQYQSMPSDIQTQIDETLERLSSDPAAHGVYDQGSDHWSATFGDGTGFILYVLSRERQKVVLLRVVSL